MRVKAAMARKGIKGLRDEGVKGAMQRFLILNFGLAEEIGSRKGRKGGKGGRGLRDEGIKLPRSRDALARGFWILDFEFCSREKVRMCKSSFAFNVVGVADLADFAGVG